MIEFARRYPWTVAFLILFLAMSVGFFRMEHVQNDLEGDRKARALENLARDKQFCNAIPNAAEAGAQALVNVLVADLRRRNGTAKEINDLLERGRRYTNEARRLALRDLPECPKILASPSP